MLSNGNNENPLTFEMSTASLFRLINIDNTADSETEAKYLDKKPEATITKTTIVLFSVIQLSPLLIILESTTSSLKQTIIHSSGFILQARKINFKTIFLKQILIINFSQKVYFLKILAISPRNCFRRKRFNQRELVVLKTKEYIIPA